MNQPARDRNGGRGEWLALGLVGVCFSADLALDAWHRDVFSWMDPYQYFRFARDVVEGHERFNQFEIPSIFPFFVMPLLAIRSSIPSAIGVNVAALLLLLLSLHRLGRELGIRTPSALVAILVLSSPLLLGLSRTLYVEFTLTAIATATFVAWLRFLAVPGFWRGLVFGTWLGVGCMTKTTFPVLMAAPVAGAVLAALVTRRGRDAAVYTIAALVPLTLTLLLHASVFARSLGYYLGLVSTDLPFMFLMGPPELASVASATYYVEEVGRSFLFLLTPLFVLPLFVVVRYGLGGPLRAALWLWLLGPLLLLTFHPLKEPRHVAICVVPAVVLLVLAFEALPRRGLRIASLAAATVLAIVQYGAVTLGAIESPYFMDRALHFRGIQERMLRAGKAKPYRATPPKLRDAHWNYDQNVAVAGFSGNEALALTWQLFPGVVFDLDTFDEPQRFFGRYAFEEFGDLFFLTGVNTYNRRCGWRWYHPTLSRSVVVANADFVILNGADLATLAQRFPQHELVGKVERASGPILVLANRGETRPYRELYARRFLEAGGERTEDEQRAVARELLMASVLAGDANGAAALLDEFPLLRHEGPVHNIYWIHRYTVLEQLASQRLSKLLPAADVPSLQPKMPGSDRPARSGRPRGGLLTTPDGS